MRVQRKVPSGRLPIALTAALATGCFARVDVAQVLGELPADAAQQRFARLAASPPCLEQLQQDDAECWESSTDAGVVVETGVSRTLHGYVTSPYTVQTHLKVRLVTRDPEQPEVYYFADGGEGGLDQREGYGRADGRINVFCATTLTDASRPALDSNHLVQQAQVDAVALCVHQAVLAGQGFGERVEVCLRDLRAPAAQLVLNRTGDRRAVAPVAAVSPPSRNGSPLRRATRRQP